jgi:UDP-N-acetylglucosamine pyrophosphorylase
VIRQVIILAAGMGTRLGKPWPKPLTPLKDGRTIMQQQMENITKTFGRHTSRMLGVLVYINGSDLQEVLWCGESPKRGRRVAT